MVNYGQKKDFQIQIENVDYYPEIAGVKVSNFPIITALSIVPLWFNHFGLSIAVLFALILFYYHSGRLEDEGKPIFLNGNLVRASKIMPAAARTLLLASFAYIKPHQTNFRR